MDEINSRLKIGYFADGPWAHGAINRFLDDAELDVVFVCCRYSNPDLRLREIAEARSIPYISIQNINSKEFQSAVPNLEADIFVSMSFDQIFKKETFSIPRLGTINCHAGKLPFYRGRNVLNWAIINGEKEFGITVHFVDEGVDTGDVILQRIFPIGFYDDYGSLLEIAYLECPKLLYDAVKMISTGIYSRISQSNMATTGMFCSQRRPGDEIIRWSDSSIDLYNFVRALAPPGPSASTYLDGQIVSIVKVEIVPGAPTYKGIPGAILAKDANGFLIKTGDSFIRLKRWQSDHKLYVGGRFQ